LTLHLSAKGLIHSGQHFPGVCGVSVLQQEKQDRRNVQHCDPRAQEMAVASLRSAARTIS
jgi:hypothetical protein